MLLKKFITQQLFKLMTIFYTCYIFYFLKENIKREKIFSLIVNYKHECGCVMMNQSNLGYPSFEILTSGRHYKFGQQNYQIISVTRILYKFWQ
jgi:hypothetical protein